MAKKPVGFRGNVACFFANHEEAPRVPNDPACFFVSAARIGLGMTWSIAWMAYAAEPVVRALSDAERDAMAGVVWHPECPVARDALVRVELDHHRPDGSVGRGALVVNADAAPAIVTAFTALFAAGFPIQRMEPAEALGDDEANMNANNTSAFACRRIGGGGEWSEHAYGTAVDINPLWNPWVRIDASAPEGRRVAPEAGRAFVDAPGDAPGVFRAGAPAVRAFTDVGWRWGGAWTRGTVDRQHFSASGR